jgi:hypothetical protein
MLMRRQLTWLFVTVALLAVAPTAAAAPPGTFDEMFPNLPDHVATDADLVAVAQSMLEGAAQGQADNNSSFVLGQFLDHDVTADPAPPGTVSQDNVRTALLDLDSVYGNGPAGTPVLYEPDRLHFRIGASPGGFPDLPRDSDGRAIVGDGRNDENLVIAQLHLAFLLRHNQFIDQGMSFADAQRRLQHQWQYLVLNEYLPRFVGDVARVKDYKPANKHDPVLPIEFAQAAFRFGHSQVRNAYNLNTNGVNRQVFSFDPAANTLLGGRPIPANARIEWTRFFDVGGVASAARNNGRRIDTDISASLFQLPIPSVVAGGGANVLAFRNMERGVDNGLASYEDVAQALGHAPAPRPADYPPVPGETPLWFGILMESEAAGGEKLGPTGGRIVNEVIRTNIERDKASILNAAPFVPTARTTGDFLAEAGQVGGPF